MLWLLLSRPAHKENIMPNPAEIAAQEATEIVFKCVRERKSFVLEAGAGPGKTYSLIEVLKHLIKDQGFSLLRADQKIACITYTNVAREVIEKRVDSNPIIFPATIHAFCWSLIKGFQKDLRIAIPTLKGWDERIAEAGKTITDQAVEYELGFPKIDDTSITLHHDDVIALIVGFMNKPKFLGFFISRFPILLIDEYQDTNTDFINALLQNFVASESGPLVGFFGDGWQKIYDKDSHGEITHQNLEIIGKRANFRSSKNIVDCLNRMRPNLTQEVSDPGSTGEISVFHTNFWTGQRRDGKGGGHWKGDLPVETADEYYKFLVNYLTQNGWDFSPEKSKILLLTHNVLADRQGYRKLADVFTRTDSFIKMEDRYIDFFVNTIEPACAAYTESKFGQFFAALGSKSPSVNTHADKQRWANAMASLLQLRETGTIGAVIDHLIQAGRPRIPERIQRDAIELIERTRNPSEPIEESRAKSLDRAAALRAVPYSEVIALSDFIKDKTPFSTKHGVKGEEYDNVFIVFGRGWSKYNFNQMLEWVHDGVPADKLDSFEKNRNLFYVTCSRPKERLCLLFTQELSGKSIKTLGDWFGAENIKSLDSIF